MPRWNWRLWSAPRANKLQGSNLNCRAPRGRHNGQRCLRHELARTQKLPEIQAVHEFHEQEIKSTRLPEIVDGDDVRMVQGGERLGLPREAFGKPRFPHTLGRQEFQRDKTVQGFLARLIDHANAAAPETLEDFKLR
jgi:hypothetical protein